MDHGMDLSFLRKVILLPLVMKTNTAYMIPRTESTNLQSIILPLDLMLFLHFQPVPNIR